MARRRILYLSRWWPEPADNGIRLRVREQIRALAREHEVRLLSFADRGGAPPAGEELRAWCTTVEGVPWRPFDPSSGRALLGFFHPTPRSLVDSFSAPMRDAVARLARDCDVVVASSLDTGCYAGVFGGRPAILDDLELGVYADRLGSGSAIGRLRAWLTWRKLAAYLRRLLPRFSACTLPSLAERALAAKAAPDYGRFHVLENAVDARACAAVSPPRAPRLLVFAGSLTYPPNRDAVCWFVERILPRVRARLPDVELAVTGDPPAEAAPPAAGVRLLGRVPDVRPVVAGAAVSIAPIRLGSGTRLKILEAMALGTPVVATSKAAEGLRVVHGEHLLLADDEGVFAAQVLRLLREPDTGARLAAAARRLVLERYDVEAAGAALRRLVERAGGGAIAAGAVP